MNFKKCPQTYICTSGGTLDGVTGKKGFWNLKFMLNKNPRFGSLRSFFEMSFFYYTSLKILFSRQELMENKFQKRFQFYQFYLNLFCFKVRRDLIGTVINYGPPSKNSTATCPTGPSLFQNLKIRRSTASLKQFRNFFRPISKLRNCEKIGRVITSQFRMNIKKKYIDGVCLASYVSSSISIDPFTT